MNIEFIKSEFEKLTLILRSWNENQTISTIERDIVLDKLKNIYDILRFDNLTTEKSADDNVVTTPKDTAAASVATTATAATEPAKAQEPAFTAAQAEQEQEEDEQDEQNDVEVEFIFADDDDDFIEATPSADQPATVVAQDAPQDTKQDVEMPTVTTAVNDNSATPESIEPQIWQKITENAAQGKPISDSTPSSQPAQQQVQQPVQQQAQQPTQQPAQHETSQAAETAQPQDNSAKSTPRSMSSLFNPEEISRQPRSKHHRMMSIYDNDEQRHEKVVDISKIFDTDTDYPTDNRTAERATERKAVQQQYSSASTDTPQSVSKSVPQSAVRMPQNDEPQPTEQPTILADTITGNSQTLADTWAKPSALAEEITHSKIKSLRQAIGINDKFLMIRDLFDGNGTEYEHTLDELERFDNLDDCMIYIVENYSWNPDSEGAKFMMQLLERKLS